MTSPRLLWKHPHLEGTGWVQPIEAIRERYGGLGEEGLRIICAAECEIDTLTGGGKATQQDLRHTLLRLAEDPASVPPEAALSVEPALLPFAFWIYGKQRVESLTPAELAECALWAWADTPDLRAGRPSRMALRRALRRLLALVPHWPEREQDELLLLVLHACKVGGARDALDLLRQPAGAQRGDRTALRERTYQAREHLAEARKLTEAEAARM